MDAEFNRRWRKGRSPFDGMTVALQDYVRLATLRQALLVVVQQLREYHSNATFWRLEDWHEHDGYVKEGERTTWQELDALLISDEALKAASTGETYVRRGYFSAERDYYLRLYVPDRYDNPFHTHDDPDLVEYGLFDVTCQQSLAKQIAEAVRATGITGIELIPAKAFFDRGYSG